MTDIPLRDAIARIIERERFGWVGNPVTLTPGMTMPTSEAMAETLLARFDIQLRSPHPPRDDAHADL